MNADQQHYINQQYEDMLEREWELYCTEGDPNEEDYDPYAEGEARWELQDER